MERPFLDYRHHGQWIRRVVPHASPHPAGGRGNGGGRRPAVASPIGDLFAPAERGRIYAFILTGELVGAGFGIVMAEAF